MQKLEDAFNRRRRRNMGRFQREPHQQRYGVDAPTRGSRWLNRDINFATSPSPQAGLPRRRHAEGPGFGVRMEEAWESTDKKFEERYDVGERLGNGSFSVVYACRHRLTGKVYAVKCVGIEHLEADDRTALEREILVLNEIAHPHIVELVEVFKEDKAYYLVMELVRGGELFDRLVTKTFLPEQVARDLLRLLIMTVNYLHQHRIIHRDIKPENILMTEEGNDVQIKVADFGFAEYVSDQEQCRAACGTPQYVAPEILQGEEYGVTVDIWSTGVMAYILLGGYPPFFDKKKKRLFDKILKGHLSFHSPFWDHVSEDAKDCIRKMLIVDPYKRHTASQLMEHKWIKGPAPPRQCDCSFRIYAARRRLRSGVYAVIALRRLWRGPRLSKSKTKRAREAAAREERAVGGTAAEVGDTAAAV